MSKTVIGVFKSRSQAEKAVDELKDFGLTKDEISIVSKDDSKGNHGGGGDQGLKSGRGGDDDLDMSMEGQHVGTGVSWGGGLGGAAGLLAGAGALAIPGVGPILAAGPLAALLTGAVTGGIAGGLVDYGIPEQEGRQYEEDVKSGGILAVIHAADDTANKVEEILRKNGGERVKSHEGKGRSH